MFRYKKSAVFLISASLIFAIIWGYEISYFVFYMIIATVGILYLWSNRNSKKLIFTQRAMKDQAYVGDVVEIKTMIYNDGLLPVPCLEVKNEMTGFITGKAQGSNIISLLPFDSRSIYEKITCKYRGYYTLGPINMTVYDVFGLFSWNKRVVCEGNLAVYPKVVKLERFSVKHMQDFGAATTKQRATEDYTSISDIRKYYPGDSFKRIHWKVSARKGFLHVKNFNMSGNSEAHIFLNLYRNDYDDIYRLDTEEKAVECATALVHYMLLKNINTGLYTNSAKASYVRGRDLKEFKKFMDEIITVKANGTIPVEELLELRSRLLPRGSSIIMVTPRLDENLIEKIIQLHESGFDVILVYIMLEEVKEEYQNIMNHFGIGIYKIRLDDDIKTALEG